MVSRNRSSRDLAPVTARGDGAGFKGPIAGHENGHESAWIARIDLCFERRGRRRPRPVRLSEQAVAIGRLGAAGKTLRMRIIGES